MFVIGAGAGAGAEAAGCGGAAFVCRRSCRAGAGAGAAAAAGAGGGSPDTAGTSVIAESELIAVTSLGDPVLLTRTVIGRDVAATAGGGNALVWSDTTGGLAAADVNSAGFDISGEGDEAVLFRPANAETGCAESADGEKGRACADSEGGDGAITPAPLPLPFPPDDGRGS